MDPTLVVIEGPAKGTLLSLAGPGVVAIGRDNSNNCAVQDPAASRRHCTIERLGGGYRLVDLNSRNGTFVNGIPVRCRDLHHGDEIRIGSSRLLFLLDNEDFQAVEDRVQLDDNAPGAESATMLRVEDALYANPGKVALSLPASERTARDLNALLAISTALQTVESPCVLERILLERVLDIIPAKRVAIMFPGKTSGEFQSTSALQRDSEIPEPIRVNPGLLHEVLGQGVAVSTGGPVSSGSPLSIIAARVGSANEALGILYADTDEPGVFFGREHLQLLAAAGSLAGLAVSNIRRMERLRVENSRLAEESSVKHDMVGESPAIQNVYRMISRVAPTNATVLITGETGTGKELVARAIHANSPRSAGPFVAVNCAAIGEGLLESELFGHERGAFTGAVAAKRGRFEIADGGTLFLDEIGEMPAGLQAKLLRVLQDHVVERVGGTRPIHVDIRIIAATNRDIELAAANGSFRQDLFYRLNVLTIRMPPLRERRDDIPLLARYFAVRAAERCHRVLTGISENAVSWLVHYDWPGNVRELEHAMERAVILGVSDVILPEDLPETVTECGPVAGVLAGTFQEAVNRAKREAIAHALERTNGVYTEAAKLLGVHPVYLHRLMRKMNLKSEMRATGAGGLASAPARRG